MAREGRDPATLLIISQVYVPDPAAVGKHLHDVAAEMVRRGWRVRVLTSARGYDDPSQRFPAREHVDGVEVQRLLFSSFGKGSIRARLIGGALFLAQATLRALFMRRPAMMLISTSPPMAPAAAVLLHALRRFPFTFWAMDLNPDQLVALGAIRAEAPLVRIFEAVNRSMLRRAARVIALDRAMAARLDAKAPVADKTLVCPPWPPIPELEEPIPHEQNAFRAEQGLEGKFVVMYSGNLSLAHPLDTILEAALRLQDDEDVVFMFVGGGQGKARLERFLREHRPKNVRLLPYQPLEALPHSLSAADVHLVVMGNEMVGIVHPCKIYGAIAVGRPILAVAPEASHVAEIVREHGLGWCVEHGDVEGVVQGVREARYFGAHEGRPSLKPFEADARQCFAHGVLVNEVVERLIEVTGKGMSAAARTGRQGG